MRELKTEWYKVRNHREWDAAIYNNATSGF